MVLAYEAYVIHCNHAFLSRQSAILPHENRTQRTNNRALMKQVCMTTFAKIIAQFCLAG